MHILTHDIEAIHDHLNRTKSPYIAMDTEFVRQKTFYPELALIQMAFEGECYLIDALAHTWNPHFVKDIIFQDFLTLVFHSCRQDMEIFFHLYKDLPKYVFDTQIAAIFLGLSSALSYEALVKHYLQLDIDKSQQHTDWLKRPLDYEQVEYAAKDVIYLADIYPKMLQDLKNCDRFEWALDEMRSLSRPSLFSVITPARLTRMGIARKHYGLAKGLFIFRDNHASALNINRSRFLSDKTLATMVTFRDEDKLRDFVLRTTSLESMGLLEAFMDTFHQYKDVDELSPVPVLTAKQQKNLTELKKHRDERGVALDLPANFLASSDDLREYIVSHTGRLATTWRKQVLSL
ncbi:MAG: hypothetical protein K2X98_05185 [Alphaproteobacteria bacterium]|nr:hypothetical protein [Alphaproteobacteria bacterium]